MSGDAGNQESPLPAPPAYLEQKCSILAQLCKAYACCAPGPYWPGPVLHSIISAAGLSGRIAGADGASPKCSTVASRPIGSEEAPACEGPPPFAVLERQDSPAAVRAGSGAPDGEQQPCTKGGVSPAAPEMAHPREPPEGCGARGSPASPLKQDRLEAVVRRLQGLRPPGASPYACAARAKHLPASVMQLKAAAYGTLSLEQSHLHGQRGRPGRWAAGRGSVEYHNLYALGEVSAAAVLALSAPLEDEEQLEDADLSVRRRGRPKQHKQGEASAAVQSRMFAKVGRIPSSF